MIVNNRNFGHVRSGYHAYLQAGGEAIVALASDLEDPPEMIPQFVRKWEEGYKIVLAQKRSSEEFALYFLIRKLYYCIVSRLSETPLVKNVTGFGLYDRQVIEDIRKIDDPYAYFRGLICELGYIQYLIPFDKPVQNAESRRTTSTRCTIWLCWASPVTPRSRYGSRRSRDFSGGAASFVMALAYLIYKLLFWNRFNVGMAPIVIGIFFSGSRATVLH